MGNTALTRRPADVSADIFWALCTQESADQLFGLLQHLIIVYIVLTALGNIVKNVCIKRKHL